MNDLMGVAVAIVVPFASAWVAQRLVRKDSMRKSAQEAFMKVSHDIQVFRDAYLNHYTTVVGHGDVSATTQTVQDAIVQLNCDCLYLGLLFDHKADATGRRIRKLIEAAQMLFSDKGPPPIDKCREGLHDDIQAIMQQMKTLWDSIR